MDLMETLVKHIYKISFEDLPADAKTAAKKAIIDTIGVIIAGSSVKGCQILLEQIREWGGRKESTIAVFGDQAPSHLAALANGTMARALEIADVFDRFPLHPSASLVPACLAIAERQGNITGKEFITAIALGHDLKIRMALANKLNPIQSGRYNLFKIFPPTGAVGKLLGLDQEQLSNAMGIAFTQMVGDGQSALDGAMTHYLQQGIVAKSAIEAALLAKRGITGAKNILQGRYGFYNAYEPDPNLEALTCGLGRTFNGVEISIKLYTSCRATHESIDLALALIREEGINPHEIDQITVRVNDQVYNLVCHPLDRKHHPQTSVDAQFSLPYTIAAAMIKGDFFIDELAEETIKNPEILRIAQRVTPVVDSKCKTDLIIGSTVMEIRTRGGKQFQRETQFPKGNPRNPISMDDCIKKFQKCINYSTRAFPKAHIEKIAECVENLEVLEDVTQLTKLIAPNYSIA